MKKYILLICIGLLGVSYSKSASNCENKLLVKMLQDLIDNSNLILPRTNDIQVVVNNLSTDTNTDTTSIIDTISQNDVIINSKLDGLEVCCDANGSQLDVIESVVEDLALSSNDAVIGEFTDIGSCLDSAIDVPDDINNLTLTVVSLLKTILLDLRGCNIP